MRHRFEDVDTRQFFAGERETVARLPENHVTALFVLKFERLRRARQVEIEEVDFVSRENVVRDVTFDLLRLHLVVFRV